MPKKTPRPRPLSGAGRGKGPGARVFRGPVRPVMNSTMVLTPQDTRFAENDPENAGTTVKIVIIGPRASMLT